MWPADLDDRKKFHGDEHPDYALEEYGIYFNEGSSSFYETAIDICS